MKIVNTYIKALLIAGCFMVIVSTVNAQNFPDAVADAGTLPVKLLSFTGEKKESDIILKWNTASENNNSHFMLQRSFNGRDFTDITKVEGNGNSGANNYSYTDINTPAANLYYRLQQVDYDGKYVTSSIVIIKNATVNISELSVYPNPVTGNQIRMMINAPKSNYTIAIKTLAGATVYSQQYNYSGGKGNIQLNLETKPAKGVYILQLSADEVTMQQRIIF